MRMVFLWKKEIEIVVDVYPFGTWLEIEGEPDLIRACALELGYTEAQYIEDGADELYLSWVQKQNLPEQWDVRFGFSGKK